MYMTNCGVYQIKNTITGDYYIGSSCNIKHRVNQHRWYLSNNKHCNPHLQRAWNVYGKPAFEFSTILLCDIENKLYYEQGLLDLLKPAYNIAVNAVASAQGLRRSDETLIKMSGRICSEETRRKIGDASRGKHPSAETRRKLSESHLGQSRPCSDEHKRKISESNKGKIRSEETCAKLSEASKGRPGYWLGKSRDKETRAKISATKKLRFAKEN
jgi:group I intron endonuclease